MYDYRSCVLGHTPPGNRFFFGTGLGNHDFANEQVGSTTLLFTYI